MKRQSSSEKAFSALPATPPQAPMQGWCSVINQCPKRGETKRDCCDSDERLPKPVSPGVEVLRTQSGHDPEYRACEAQRDLLQRTTDMRFHEQENSARLATVEFGSGRRAPCHRLT